MAGKGMPEMTSENPYAAPNHPTEPAHPSATELYFRGRRMYFWNVSRLKANLRQKPLSDRESLPYLVVFVMMMTIAASVPVPEYNLWDALGWLWSIVLAVLGTIYIYRQNGGSQGRYFLQRYLAVGWVVGVRCLAAIFVCAIALFGTLAYSGQWLDESTWYDFVFFAIAEVVVYWRIGHHVHDLAHVAGST